MGRGLRGGGGRGESGGRGLELQDLGLNVFYLHMIVQKGLGAAKLR